VDGNRVAIAFSVTATHQGEFMGLAGSGRRCAFEGVSLYQLDADLLLEEERRVYDFTGLLAQVGVVRIRPAS
jgi:predicted ester cyclase